MIPWWWALIAFVAGEVLATIIIGISTADNDKSKYIK